MMRGGMIRKTPARRIDWEQTRARLQASERALEAALSESPARLEAALDQRAVQIAKGRPRQRFGFEESKALAFWVGQERYAIELKELAEVFPYAKCATAPGSAPEFCGVVNVRGDLRSVVDLKRLMRGPADDDGASGFVLMLRRPGRAIGLKVDRVEGMLEVRPDQLLPSENSRFAKRMRGEARMLLDVDQVLAEVFAGGKTP